MRRADPPPPTPEPEAATTLSDVGSSPRSVGAGGRSGSLSEEQHQHHHSASSAAWGDATFSRVKLMCSYGGRILPRPHDNQLRYIGGETRIVVVSRAISFADLAAKLSRTFGSAVVVKYQLPYEDLDALISVSTDEDLENMMEEYDRLQAHGNRSSSSSSRLRLFLFPAKLERSQTSSLSDLLGSSQNRERWFLDALNNSPPILHRLRSDASSIFSEPTDFLRSNAIDSLEEWAAAASYGNSSSQQHDDGNHHLPHSHGSESISASLFGSLLQRSISGEVFSAPESPSLLKSKSSLTGSFSSSSSAPAAVMSILSAIKDTDLKEQLAAGTQQAGPDINGNLIAVLRGFGNLGSSGGGGGSVDHEQKELLQTSIDKGVSRDSTEQKQAVVEEDIQKQLRVSASSSEQNTTLGRVLLQERSAIQGLTAAATKGPPKQGIPPLLGQPIFDDEDDNDDDETRASHGMSANHVEERGFVSPPMLVTASQHQMPSIIASDDKSKLQSIPLSVLGIAPGFQVETVPSSAYVLSQSDVPSKPDGNERTVQQALPPSHGLVGKPASEEMFVSNIMPLSSAELIPTVAHGVMSNLSADERVMQQMTTAASATMNDDKLMQHQVTPVLRPLQAVVGPPSAPTREEDVNQLLQQPFPGIPPTLSSATSVQPIPQHVMQKPVVTPVAPHFYQLQVQKQMTEERMPAVASVDQMPVVMPPGIDSTTAPMLRTVKELPGTNVSSAAVLRSQSPPESTYSVAAAAAPQQVLAQPMPRVKTSSPPLSAPLGEVSKVAVTNVNTFSTVGEPVTSVHPTVHQLVEIPNLSRQTSDQFPGQRLVRPNRTPQQFTIPTVSTPAAPGLPSQLRFVGSPIVHVVEGIPQLYEKKMPAPVQRATQPTRIVPAVQNSYYVIDHPDAPATGIPFYKATSTVMIAASGNSDEAVPYTGANPFVDDFSSQMPSYKTVNEVLPQDQLQRQPTPPAVMKAKMHQVQK